MGNKLFSRGERKEITYETALFLFKSMIISVIIIIFQILHVLLFFCATGLSALPYASAQQPLSLRPPKSRRRQVQEWPPWWHVIPHHQTKPHPESLCPANSQVRQPDRTKVIRIYGGAGFFDLLLAEKLRPRLSKGFAASRTGIAKPNAVEIAAPAQVDGPKPIPVVSNL